MTVGDRKKFAANDDIKNIATACLCCFISYEKKTAWKAEFVQSADGLDRNAVVKSRLGDKPNWITSSNNCHATIPQNY